MLQFVLSLLLTSVVSQVPPGTPKNEESSNVRVMTLNVWESGLNVEDGHQKIAKHIEMVNPDVVALQEVYLKEAENITKMLGPDWTYVEHPSENYPDLAILTRHHIIPNTFTYTYYGIGCTIMLENGRVVNVWNVHLDYWHYGPSEAFKENVANVSQILATEFIHRVPGLFEIINSPVFQTWLSETSEIPIIFCGDFNAPSHLDWAEETKSIHNNWVVEWPATKYLESNGFIDSFREVYPNVLENPGFSWSTVHDHSDKSSYTGPEERLDFIFYTGQLSVLQSIMYAGSEPIEKMPNHKKNDWPSDHYAFFTDFRFL